MTLFKLNKESNTSNWRIMDDVVMGGHSNGDFKISDSGKGVFSGEVSLENNGGFSMVQHHFETVKTASFSTVCLKIKGDGKHYQFRLKSNIADKHSYIAPFKTSGDWETIEIPFNVMYPAYRGKLLDIPNFKGQQVAMIAFLIGNKKAETFNLEIDSITFK